MIEKSSSRIVEIDSLRGLAALAVVVCHLLFMRKEFQDFEVLGFWGVALFFIISGYVISMTVRNRPSVGKFLLNRFSRLYPAYWFSVIMVSAIWFITNHGKVDYGHIAANFTMLQNWMNIPDLDGVYWTLKIELCFYFLIVILLAIKQIDQIEKWGGFFLVICMLLQIYFRWFTQPSEKDTIIHLFPLISDFSYFYAGILFYKIMEQSKLTPYRIFSLLACFAYGIYAIQDFGNVHLDKSPLYVYILLAISCYAIFFLLQFGKIGWIQNKAFVFLGGISYSLYITHFYISFCFLLPNLEKHGVHWIVSRIITIAIIFPLAYYVHIWVEIPLMKKLRHLMPSKQVKQTSLVP